MASNNVIKWSQINALYTKLNTARKKFSFSTISAPSSYTDKIAKLAQITTLNNFIEQMSSNANLGSNVSNMPDPVKDQIMKFNSEVSTIESKLDWIINTACNFGNSSFGNSSFGDSSWGDSSFSFSSWGDSSWGNSGWGNSSWGNSSWGNSSFDGVRNFNFDFKDGFNTSGFNYGGNGTFDW